MNQAVSFFLTLFFILATGCSASKKSMLNRNQDSANEMVHYHIRARAIEGGILDSLIEKQFRALENLKLRKVKIHYGQKDIAKYQPTH